MEPKKRYKVVVNDSGLNSGLSFFESTCDKLLAEGWWMHGSLVVDANGYMFQVMTREI